MEGLALGFATLASSSRRRSPTASAAKRIPTTRAWSSGSSSS